MKKLTYLFPKKILFLILLLINYCSFGQVSYKIGLDADKVTYRVFMKSVTGYSGIQAKISTAQVTIVVPHGIGANQFQVNNLQGKIVGPNQMSWSVSRVDSPSEKTSSDYISFGYSGSGNSLLFDIIAGQEVELFNFKNTGNCLGSVDLIATGDLFLPPNSVNTNPGNQMTVLGFGQTNAYQSNYGGSVTCQTNTTNADLGVSILLDKTTPSVGETINYTFNITNNGSDVPLNVQNQIVLPTGFSMTNFNTNAGTFNQNTGIWNVNSIPVGQTFSLTITGKPTAEGVAYATSQIINSSISDNNSANNGASVCYSILVRLCSDATYMAHIDKKYSNIQWYKNSIMIAEATADSLLINSAGTYTFTSSTPCPQGGCCPIVVTTGQVANDLSVSPPTITTCGNYNLTNLTVSLNNTILTNNLTYYANQTDASTGSNPIGSIVNKSGIYWVRYKPTDTCGSVGSVNVGINSSLAFTQPAPICAATFDLSSIALFNDGVQVTSGINYYAAIYNSPSSVIIIPLDNPIISSTGLYYATIKNPSGCISLASIQVKLLTPKMLNIQDASNVCPANWVNLIALQPNPSTIGNTFEWHISNSPTSPLFTNPSTAGLGTYYVFEKNPTGCYSLGDAVKVSIKDCCTSPDCLPFRLVKVKF